MSCDPDCASAFATQFAEAVSPYLKTRILTNIRHEADRPVSWFGWRQRLSAVAAVLVVGIGTAFVVRELLPVVQNRIPETYRHYTAHAWTCCKRKLLHFGMKHGDN